MFAFVQLTEQVWVPIHRIARVSLFGPSVAVHYIDGSVEHFKDEDAQRILKQLKHLL
jgi:hypothetical protein